MIAILRYTDCLHDGRDVFSVLANRNVEILKTKQGISIYPEVTIKVKDREELNSLLYDLNKHSTHGVRLVKTKPDSIFSAIKRLFA